MTTSMVDDGRSLLRTSVRLAFPYRIEDESVVIDRAGQDFELRIEGLSGPVLGTILAKLQSGALDIAEVTRESGLELDHLLHELDSNSLLDHEVGLGSSLSGIEAYFEIEDLANRMMATTLYRNSFWSRMLTPNDDIPLAVFHGLAIENYHFLFRESYFDSPVLSFQGATRARLLMNEFYVEEIGHDLIILKALNSIGISAEDLYRSRPLPETLAMCNALAFWAASDPLFFFTTLGILEGKEVRQGEQDSFIAACEAVGLPDTFVAPLRAHANINRDAHHGDLTRAIFRAIPQVDVETQARLKRQTRLFVEMYDAFYEAVWQHYSTASQLLRPVPCGRVFDSRP